MVVILHQDRRLVNDMHKFLKDLRKMQKVLGKRNQLKVIIQ